jgi:CheY-like chemotaxis protein/two-component sensor histidine kinase
MALLLDDLLDVSRISRGKLQLRLARIDLASVVAAAVETSAPLVEARRHRLEVVLPPQPVALMADPVRMAQVLGNLLSNAAKYTPPGGTIRLVAQQEADRLLLHVRDNGLGLSPEHIEAIFDMFSQVAAAAEHAQGGLGIGLALSRGLVQLHGGTLQARSEGPGQGAEFTVALPLPAQPAAHGDTEDARTPEAARDAVRRRRVLIADDNADALSTMAMLLEMEGHEVHTAGDGEQAVAQAEAVRPDIAILDIGMPRLNGHEVAARIRSAEWGKRVLLIALTGWGQAHDQERARAAGFDHHCTKPVDLAQLLALVDEAA